MGSLVLLALCLGIGLGVGVPRGPSYPVATPWWRRGLFYHLHLPTFANDVDGPIGRLSDAIARFPYISDRVMTACF
ncbi:unnamed protein product [Protopolystoma xenopodis]|uniref:Uncharacterized protein n=1 Tax=Protopolystoma xenopodis TaxID=117903 RepID=A0A3S5FGG2_9PLAT|nr:unnamed protein product [Protopolystoma xenopodis]